MPSKTWMGKNHREPLNQSQWSLLPTQTRRRTRSSSLSFTTTSPGALGGLYTTRHNGLGEHQFEPLQKYGPTAALLSQLASDSPPCHRFCDWGQEQCTSCQALSLALKSTTFYISIQKYLWKDFKFSLLLEKSMNLDNNSVVQFFWFGLVQEVLLYECFWLCYCLSEQPCLKE